MLTFIDAGGSSGDAGVYRGTGTRLGSLRFAGFKGPRFAVAPLPGSLALTLEELEAIVHELRRRSGGYDDPAEGVEP